MMRSLRGIRLGSLLVVLLSGGVLGCQNPTAVRQLATTSAANVTTIQSGIRAMAGQSELVWDARARNVARQHGVVTSLRADLELDRELMRKTGSSADATAAELARWSKKILETYEQATGAEAKRQEQLIAQRAVLEQRREALSAAARNLATLGEDQSLGDRLGFVGGYLANVGKDLAARRKVSEAAAEAAAGAITVKSAAAGNVIRENTKAKPGGNE